MRIENVFEAARLVSVRDNIIARRRLIADGDVRVSIGGSGYWKPDPLVMKALVAAENEKLRDIEASLLVLGVSIDDALVSAEA